MEKEIFIYCFTVSFTIGALIILLITLYEKEILK